MTPGNWTLLTSLGVCIGFVMGYLTGRRHADTRLLAACQRALRQAEAGNEVDARIILKRAIEGMR